MQATTRAEVENKAKSRHHLLLSFPEQYLSVFQSKINLKCLKCGAEWETKLSNYNNCKNGCLSCKKKISSVTHKNKIVSESTRLLIAKKASSRPGSLTGVHGEKHPAWKGGYGRDINKPSNQDYVWKNQVKKLYNFACIVTGQVKNVESHHLYSWNKFREMRYNPQNGVLLHKEIHKHFHNLYGYGNNTEFQFASFLLDEYNLYWQDIKKG